MLADYAADFHVRSWNTINSTMKFIKVEESNIDKLYELNVQLAEDEKQKSLFTASRSSYSSAFLADHPILFGFLAFVNNEPVGFYVYCFKFATYIGARVIYIEDLYLKEEFRTKENNTTILKHTIKQATLEKCCRAEMRVLRSFNIGYRTINEVGFNQIKKWDVFRCEQDCK